MARAVALSSVPTTHMISKEESMFAEHMMVLHVAVSDDRMPSLQLG
jgi:hypothetical protein